MRAQTQTNVEHCKSRIESLFECVDRFNERIQQISNMSSFEAVKRSVFFFFFLVAVFRMHLISLIFILIGCFYSIRNWIQVQRHRFGRTKQSKSECRLQSFVCTQIAIELNIRLILLNIFMSSNATAMLAGVDSNCAPINRFVHKQMNRIENQTQTFSCEIVSEYVVECIDFVLIWVDVWQIDTISS